MQGLSNRKALDKVKAVADVIFQMIDFRQDGIVDRGELTTFTRTVGPSCSMWSTSFCDFAVVDKSGDRQICPAELCDHLQKAYRQLGKRKFIAQMGLVTMIVPARDAPEDIFVELRGGAGCIISDTEERGISIEQLQAVVEYTERRCEADEWCDEDELSPTFKSRLRPKPEFLHEVDPTAINLYHVVDKVIRPATKQRLCSWVEYVAKGPQPPHWFVSHYWGDAIAHSVACLTQHTLDRELPPDTMYWICAYANNQWDLAYEMCESPASSSFRRAMERSLGTVTVLDPEAGCFSRIWCCYEIWFSIVDRFDEPYHYDMYTVGKDGPCGITDGCASSDLKYEYPVDAKRQREMKFPLQLCRRALSTRLQDAKASRTEDRRCILNSIARSHRLDADPPQEHEEYDKLNRVLAGHVSHAIWGTALEAGEDMDPYLEALCNCDLPTLELTFDSSQNVTDNDVAKLATSIGVGLKELLLDFSYCRLISDKALFAIAEKLSVPMGLRRISLSFMVNAKREQPLTDDSLKALGAAIPDTVSNFALNLYGCHSVGDEGIEQIIAGLPADLDQLDLNLSFNEKISSQTVFRLPPVMAKLSVLKLNLHYCQSALTDEALQALGSGIQNTFETLHLDLRFGEALTSPAVRELFRQIKERAPDLRDLVVDCNRCSLLDDAAIPAVLPARLTRLRIGLGFCPRLSPVAVKTLARAMPLEVETLALDFSECPQAIPSLAEFQPLIDEMPKKIERVEMGLQGVSPECAQSIEEALKNALAMQEALVFVHRAQQLSHS